MMHFTGRSVSKMLAVPIYLHVTWSISCVCSFQSSAVPLPQVAKEAIASRLWATAKNDDKTMKESDKTKEPLLKLSWYAAEMFGKIFAPARNQNTLLQDSGNGDEIDLQSPPSSLKEAVKRIELDNARSYFLSGNVDIMAYDTDCIFADPFVTFSGRQRFVDNLSNLGSFITNYDAKMIKYEVIMDQGINPIVQVQTKVMVKLQLNLPWNPILAWPWGVTYTIDPDTCLITKHLESWDISAWDGIKQLFRKPTLSMDNNPL